MFCPTMTSCSGLEYCSGCSSTASTAEKMAVVDPMASASVSTTAKLNPGFFKSWRTAKRRSCNMHNILSVCSGAGTLPAVPAGSLRRRNRKFGDGLRRIRPAQPQCTLAHPFQPSRLFQDGPHLVSQGVQVVAPYASALLQQVDRVPLFLPGNRIDHHP